MALFRAFDPCIADDDPLWRTPAGRCALLLMLKVETHFLGSGVANFRRVRASGGTYYEGYDADKDRNERYRNEFRMIAHELERWPAPEDARGFLRWLPRSLLGSNGRYYGYGAGWHHWLLTLVEHEGEPLRLEVDDMARPAEEIAAEHRAAATREQPGGVPAAQADLFPDPAWAGEDLAVTIQAGFHTVVQAGDRRGETWTRVLVIRNLTGQPMTAAARLGSRPWTETEIAAGEEASLPILFAHGEAGGRTVIGQTGEVEVVQAGGRSWFRPQPTRRWMFRFDADVCTGEQEERFTRRAQLLPDYTDAYVSVAVHAGVRTIQERDGHRRESYSRAIVLRNLTGQPMETVLYHDGEDPRPVTVPGGEEVSLSVLSVSMPDHMVGTQPRHEHNARWGVLEISQPRRNWRFRYTLDRYCGLVETRME